MTVLSKKKPQVTPEDGKSLPSCSQYGHALPSSTAQAHSQTNTTDERMSPQRWPMDNNDNVMCSNQMKHRILRSPQRKDRARDNKKSPNSVACECGSIENLCSTNCGYNSEDEYGDISKQCEIEWEKQDYAFEKKLKKHGLILKEMKNDGACLFRAVSDQLYGDQDMHDIVRKQCIDYISSNKDYYIQYVTEDFNNYIARKKLDRTHGNHVEIHAMSELYNRPIEVYCYGTEPINIFNSGSTEKSSNPPIRLSYQRSSHYNSIVDPYKATIGVGLGFPNFSPGSADKKLLTDAVLQSEQYMLEQTMLEDKLKATDWEATNNTIEEQIARESYLQFLRDNEKRNKKEKESSTKTSTATSVSCAIPYQSQNSHPKYCVGPKSPTQDSHSSTYQDHFEEECQSISSLSPSLFGISKWDNVGILSQVLANSQQEYLDSLKRQRDNKEDSDTKYLYDADKPSTSQ